jgi:hypothetical protein
MTPPPDQPSAESVAMVDALQQASAFLSLDFDSVDDFDKARAALLAHIAKLEANDRRYRWLRDDSWKLPYAPGPLYTALYDFADYKDKAPLRKVWLRYGAALDTAIDAALAAEQKGE